MVSREHFRVVDLKCRLRKKEKRQEMRSPQVQFSVTFGSKALSLLVSLRYEQCCAVFTRGRDEMAMVTRREWRTTPPMLHHLLLIS